MQVISGLHNLSRRFEGGVLTLGIFDGVHRGHQKILRHVVARAKARRLKSIVVTFSPHPLAVLRPSEAPPLLATLKKRLMLLEDIGIDVCIIINFTRQFSRLRAEEFVSDILVKQISMKEMVVSKEIRFGRRGEGGAGLLSTLSKKEGFRLIALDPVYAAGEAVSSTRIRRLIQMGNLKEAEKFLGRPYSLQGTVMRGARRGISLGFPTANIMPHHEVLPPPGVYAGYVLYENRRYRALANFGFRPTFYGKEKSFEVHIFNFKKDIYHRELEFIFKHYLRPERHFPARGALIQQIGRDRKRAMKLLF